MFTLKGTSDIIESLGDDTMTQKELIELLENKVGIVKSSVYQDKKDTVIQDITYNSKACIKNSAFFVKGVNFKEEYVLDAINNGAFLVIAEKEYETQSVGIIIVKDIRKAMVVVAEEFFNRAYEKINMIGLTGTKGKTTTATYIHNILNDYLKKRTALLSTVETYTGTRCEESHLSTPEAIELQRYINEANTNDLQYLTMEVSSQAYKTNRILNMQYDIGVFLNISEDHISPAEHPNFTDYLNSKLEFIKNCKTVIINKETDYYKVVEEAAKNSNKVITYGSEKVEDNVDYYYTNLRKEQGYLTFDIVHNLSIETYRTKMFGDFNAQNATAAIIVAKELGIPLENIQKGIQETTVSGRMNIFEKNNKTIVVDYAHNRLSFEKFFETIKKDYPTNEIVAVFGAPGGKAYIRRKDMAEVASKYSDKIYLTADDPQFESVRDICNEMAQFTTCDYEIIEDREQAINKAFEEMQENGVLCLLAKGEDKYQQVRGKLEEYISDVGMARKLTE